MKTIIQSVLAAAVALFAASHVSAQEMRPAMTAESASTILHTCRDYALENDIALSIAVYDQAVNLVAFLRMDGASLASIGIAQWKGEGAATFNAPTGGMAQYAERRPGLTSIPGFVTLQGGLPVRTSDGAPIGGVGVSGAASQVDEDCAAAGIEAAGLTTTRTPEEEAE